MKATSGELPAGEGWAYEVKWDGMRLIADVDGEAGTLALRTTNDLDATARFPEVAGLAGAVGPHRVVLDGEVVAVDESGRPSFGLLQSRMHVVPGAGGDRGGASLSYVLFDLLRLDGTDTTGLAYEQRRRLLDQVVDEGPTWRLSPVHRDGEALLAAARAQGLEGVMAKRIDSRYEPGKRSRSWIKVKVRPQQELVVGGWLPGEGRRAGGVGSLLVGYWEEGDLRYAGRVGTGFSQDELDRLEAVLGPLEQPDSPFADPLPRPVLRLGPHLCRPEVVVEVAFAEWTGDHRLRHPAYLGQRHDKDPAEVVREPTPWD